MSGLVIAFDRAIKIVRETEEDELVVPNLMEHFGIDKIQAEFVAEIKLRNLNKQYILKRIEETALLQEEIGNLEYILSSEKEVKKIIIDELKNVIKKYGEPRKTEIIEGENIEVYSEEQYIEDYNLKVFFTKDNYLKKISLVSLRSASEQKLKEGDKIICEFDSVNRADLLLFSNMHNVYKVRLHEIADCKASSWGEFLPNLLGLGEEEKIVYAVPTEKYEGFMLFAFENGKIAKVPMNSYATKLNRKKLTNAYGSASPLANALFIPEEKDIMCLADSGKILVLDSKDVPLKTTRSTQGVQIMRLKKGSKLTSLILPENSEFSDPLSYKARALPSGGYYPKGDDDPQLSLF